MAQRLRSWARPVLMALVVGGLPGCAVVRNHHPSLELRPCSDGFARTDDGWRLGIKHFRPAKLDPAKPPVVLCHGLGLNGTFWTITDDNLPKQLTARGYDVYVVDMRGSGASRQVGLVGRVNSLIRHTLLVEVGEHGWNVDDEAFHDVPAILDYVERSTGHRRVNWIGHSLGGMIMFPYLELVPTAHERIASFVAMGSPVVLTGAPNTPLLKANRGICNLLQGISTSRIARPMMFARPPGLEAIDRFYYSSANVDRQTVDRFYGYTLEDPGPGALRQLSHYLRGGHLVSADRSVDYAALVDRVQVPTLYVAGEGDVLAPMDSMVWTYEAAGGTNKTLMRFGKRNGHQADYGHCDLVWSRQAPREIFPAVADWLDRNQLGSPSAQSPPEPPRPSAQTWPR